MLAFYLDESGTHSLNPIEPEYPVFVLAGCLMDQSYHDKTATERMNQYKTCLWRREDIILHTSGIVGKQKGFENLRDEAEWEKFLRKTNRLMSELDYMVIACAILKNAHKEKYGGAAFNPYYFSLEVLVERLVFEHRDRKEVVPAQIIAESRGEVPGRRLDLAWKRLKRDGTSYIGAKEIRTRIKDDVVFFQKKENICGLQLADLVASPIGRKVLGRLSQNDWEIVKGKFRTNPRGRYTGWGLIILPKKGSGH